MSTLISSGHVPLSLPKQNPTLDILEVRLHGLWNIIRARCDFHPRRLEAAPGQKRSRAFVLSPLLFTRARPRA